MLFFLQLISLKNSNKKSFVIIEKILWKDLVFKYFNLKNIELIENKQYYNLKLYLFFCKIFFKNIFIFFKNIFVSKKMNRMKLKKRVSYESLGELNFEKNMYNSDLFFSLFSDLSLDKIAIEYTNLIERKNNKIKKAFFFYCRL